ncbi:MAG: hypothetical protein WD876_03405 [Candidatus Pacearchaeota archaeon]
MKPKYIVYSVKKIPDFFVEVYEITSRNDSSTRPKFKPVKVLGNIYAVIGEIMHSYESPEKTSRDDRLLKINLEGELLEDMVARRAFKSIERFVNTLKRQNGHNTR